MTAAGICSVSFRPLSVEEMIELSSSAGLDCIEWGGDIHVPAGNIERAKQVAALTKDAGLSIHSYGSYYRCGEDEDFSAVSKTAHALGAENIRVWAGKKDSQLFSDEEFSRLVETVRAAADLAARYGQTLAFEHHHGTYCNTPESTLRLLQSVNRNNVKTYWQPAYWQSTDSLDIDVNAIKLLRDHIVGVHIYHWRGTERLPLAEGLSNWQKFVELLGENKFYLEFFAGDSIEQFRIDAAVLKDVLKNR